MSRCTSSPGWRAFIALGSPARSADQSRRAGSDRDGPRSCEPSTPAPRYASRSSAAPNASSGATDTPDPQPASMSASERFSAGSIESCRPLSPSASQRRHHFDTVARDTSICAATWAWGVPAAIQFDHDPPTSRRETGITVRHRGSEVLCGLFRNIHTASEAHPFTGPRLSTTSVVPTPRPGGGAVEPRP